MHKVGISPTARGETIWARAWEGSTGRADYYAVRSGALKPSIFCHTREVRGQHQAPGSL